MSNDKKNNDEKINFILLKKIGKTTRPDKNKISIKELKRLFPKIISI
jgi:3-dehydroquinate synthetase